MAFIGVLISLVVIAVIFLAAILAAVGVVVLYIADAVFSWLFLATGIVFILIGAAAVIIGAVVSSKRKKQFAALGQAVPTGKRVVPIIVKILGILLIIGGILGIGTFAAIKLIGSSLGLGSPKASFSESELAELSMLPHSGGLDFVFPEGGENLTDESALTALGITDVKTETYDNPLIGKPFTEYRGKTVFEGIGAKALLEANSKGELRSAGVTVPADKESFERILKSFEERFGSPDSTDFGSEFIMWFTPDDPQTEVYDSKYFTLNFYPKVNEIYFFIEFTAYIET